MNENESSALMVEFLSKVDEKDTKIDFGNEYITRGNVQKGGQANVILVENKSGKTLALKLYPPTSKSEDFFQEIGNLIKLSHKNIVTMYSTGTATIERDGESGFKVETQEYDVKPNETDTDNTFYFYIMDYIEGVHADKVCDNNKTECVRLYELLIRQIGKAMAYYHKMNVVHKDIKAKNILYREEDEAFILVDFGFSRDMNGSDFSAAPEQKQLQKRVDIEMFAELLDKQFKKVKNKYPKAKMRGIETIIKGAKDGNYVDINKFYNEIRQYFVVLGVWHFQPKIDEYMTGSRFGRFDSKLRIPVSGSILLTKEVKAIIDTREFQRLRGVRQLGPTIFVFPGANHTRFEHSLGVYHMALKYLEKLLSIPEFRTAFGDIEKNIKLVILAALLHDIGHYPYSHWIEEMVLPHELKVDKHEKRALQILNRGEIRKVIKKIWKLKPKEIAKVIEGSHENKLLNSIISSAIDVDKLDYLKRDSVHCGVSYGHGIDTDRLITSLYFDAGADVNIDENKGKICLTKKGKSVLLSLLSTRNIMYQEVYWHKTVRASEAMFKRFFYRFLEEEHKYVKKNDAFKESAQQEILGYLNKSDDQFIALLHNSAEKKPYQHLIEPFAFKGRKIYKPAYIFYMNQSRSDKERDAMNLLFGHNYEGLLDLSVKFTKILKNSLKGIKLKQDDIIFEITPINENKEKYILDGFRIFNERIGKYIDYSNSLDSLNQYLSENKQAYLFCHPAIYDKLSQYITNHGDKFIQNLLDAMSTPLSPQVRSRC